MSNLATWVVPPTYEAKLYGYDAAEITARKVHLIKDGKRVYSYTYGKKDHVPTRTFFGLIQLAVEKDRAKK